MVGPAEAIEARVTMVVTSDGYMVLLAGVGMY